MKIVPLTGGETLEPLGVCTSSQFRDIMRPRAAAIQHAVGTIEIPGLARGMACLLEDGAVLTCLHTILDYRAAVPGRLDMIDPARQNITVNFVKDNTLYQYQVAGILASGIDKLRAYGTRALCFDYAVLRLESNPLAQLGSGFTPDNIDHFSPACVTDTGKTLAVSGPFLTVVADGSIHAHRYVSLSDNAAGLSTNYFYAQVGDHPTAPGFSGQAMVSIADRSLKLYAVHSYRNGSGVQGGVKISEITHAMRTGVAPGYYPVDPFIYPMLMQWYEVLRKATRAADGSVTRGTEITFDEAVRILQRGGDIVGDNRKETEAAAKGAWGIRLIRDDPHLPRGLPHFHDPDRSYSSHAFYPGAAASRGK